MTLLPAAGRISIRIITRLPFNYPLGQLSIVSARGRDT